MIYYYLAPLAKKVQVSVLLKKNTAKYIQYME